MTDKKKIEDERTMMISKSNKMIRNSRFSLSTMEQKILIFLFSKIKPEDTDLTEYQFEIKHFCEVCGIDYSNGGNYQYIKSVIKKLADSSFWIMDDNGTETLCRWIRTARLNKGSGKGILKLSEDILTYAVGLIKEGHYTQYMMLYTMPMKGKHSRHLYELLKSREHDITRYKKKSIIFGLDDLKHFLMADEYGKYNDFKRYALNYSVVEINEYTDLQVEYKEIPLKTGKKGKPPVGSLEFFIQTRDEFDVTITRKADHNILNDEAKLKFTDQL